MYTVISKNITHNVFQPSFVYQEIEQAQRLADIKNKKEANSAQVIELTDRDNMLICETETGSYYVAKYMIVDSAKMRSGGYDVEWNFTTAKKFSV